MASKCDHIFPAFSSKWKNKFGSYVLLYLCSYKQLTWLVSEHNKYIYIYIYIYMLAYECNVYIYKLAYEYNIYIFIYILVYTYHIFMLAYEFNIYIYIHIYICLYMKTTYTYVYAYIYTVYRHNKYRCGSRSNSLDWETFR